jgi:iron complex transport system permease protein
MGGLVLLLLDNVSRTAMSVEIPLGILAGLIGIPAFVLLFMRILKEKGGWH